MINMLKRCFIMALFIFGLISAANAGVYSFITKATGGTKNGITTITYNFTISSWTTESDNQPSPCAGATSCIIFISHRHYSDGTSGVSWVRALSSQDGYVDITGLKTIGDVRKKIMSSGYALPFSDMTEHTDTGSHVDNECVSFFYSTDPDKDPGNGHYPMFPTAICGVAPPPTGHCQFNTHDVKLDYGSVSPDALNGKQVSSAVTVSCDASMNLEAWLVNPQDGSDTVPLRADGSLFAKLTLDGENASTIGKAFSVTSGGSQTLTITSEAVVSGTPEAGEFSGSAVLFLSVP